MSVPGQCKLHRAFSQSTLAVTRTQRPTRRTERCIVKAHRPDHERVVITGMGVASCFGNDVDTFYDSLLAGKSGVKEITRFDASEFPTRFAAQIENFQIDGMVDRKNARRYDDCLTYSVVASKKALKQAGLDKQDNADAYGKLDLTKAGVLVGTGMGGLTVFQDGVKNLVEKGHKKISPFFIPYAITNMGSALVAMDLGFMGPNYSISTACATANYCFVAAANHIRKGDADIIIAGGSEAPIIPVGVGGFVACRALSTRNGEPEKASRPWDTGRDGFVMGEGAGVLVMESLEHAQKRGANILGEYLGGAITCDAYHMTDPRADGLGVKTCIELALKDSAIERDQVNYVNAHATSTLVGDVAEVRAVRSAFPDMSKMKMNSTKSMIGHCLGAAGGMEAIATLKAIQTGWVHPTLNQDNLVDEVADLNTVPNEKQELDITAGISNSFGFGGHNSVVAFAPFKQ
ncbi:3-oxoacyl-[acyl-carrier-protein] synthase I, chloroplastic [Trebouxia sp. C0010 RCD-2024]